MTIKTYLAHLEKTKQDLLALNLPENTRLVNPSEADIMLGFGDISYKFTTQEVWLKNNHCYPAEYFRGEQLTKKENVVVVKGVCYSR